MTVKIGKSPVSKARMLETLLATVPVEGALDYYGCLLKSMVKNRSIINLGRPNVYLERPVVVKQGKRLFYLDGYTGFVSSVFIRAYEPNTYDAIIKSSGELFVDVGAYTGIYSINAAVSFNNIIALEPNPHTADILRKNIQMNKTSNVEVVQKAASDKTGPITLYEGIFSSTYTTAENFVLAKPGGTKMEISGITLDSLLSPYDRIDLVKIDVEGSELSVLEGAKETLPRIQKLIVEVDKGSSRDVMRLLRGFRPSPLEEGDLSDNIMFIRVS